MFGNKFRNIAIERRARELVKSGTFEIVHEQIEGKGQKTAMKRKTHRTKCYACKRKLLKFRFNIFNFCRPCWNKNFVRPNGTLYEGMDFTRQLVRIRDKHTCQKCRKVWKRGQRRFDIHHLGGLCGNKSRTYDNWIGMTNLITLCHKCHLNLDEVRSKMSQRSSQRPTKDKERQEIWQRENRKYLREYVKNKNYFK